MNIKQTIITAAVALTMVAMIAPMGASASTASNLQAEISALQAQLNTLGSSTTSMPADCVGVTFTRNLRVGMSGQDVQCLQAILNMSASTQVSLSGAGSPGMESMYFGPKTLAAVQIWQAAQGFTPAAQIGPLSRAKLNAWLSSASTTSPTTPVTTPTGLPEGCTSSSGYSPVTGAACSSGTVTQTGPVSVVLSSDTPASAAIVGGQATADLAHFTFNGSGTVTSVTLNRSGISDQNTLSNVYLYEGNTPLTQGYTFNSSGQLVMNNLAIVVNGSQEIYVKADVEANAAETASTIAISLTGYTANGTTSTANVIGNTMTIAIGNLATASLGANTVTGNPTVNAGTTAYTFWSAPIQINTRAVWLKTADFQMIGSAPSDALANIRLLVDGVDTGVTGTVVSIQGSNYVDFDLTAAPVSLMTGSHTLQVNANVVDGSDRTIQLSLQNSNNLTLFDPQVGVNIAVVTQGQTSLTPNAAASVSINTGSAVVTIDPTFNAMTNISGGTTNAVIGKFDVTAYGEAIKVQSVTVTPVFTGQVTNYVSGYTGAGSNTIVVGSTTGFTAGNVVTIGAATASITSITNSTTMVVNVTTAGTPTGNVTVQNEGLNNVTLYFDGSQVGTQQQWPSTGGSLTFQLGSQMIIPAGTGTTNTFEVHADLQSNTGDYDYTGGTVATTVDAGTSNAQGQTSLTTLNFPTANVVANTLTIQTGLLAVSQNTGYLNQSVSPNTAGVEIGSFVLQNQSTSEPVRITQYTVALGGSEALTNLSGLYTSDTTGSGSTPIQPASTNTFSVNDTLQPGATMTLNIFANSSTQTGVNVITTLTVSSIGTISNVSNAGSAVTGQTITFGTGTLATPSIVVSSTTPAQYIPSGPTGATNAAQAVFNFVSTGGPSTINDLKFTVSGSDASPSQTVTSVCVTPVSGAAICAQPVSGVAYLTGLSLAVPNGGSGLTQPVQVSYSGVGTSGIAPSTMSSISLSYVQYTSGGTTTTITPGIAAPTMTLVGSVPTLTIASGGNGGLVLNTEQQVGQVTVTASSQGSIKVNTITFNLGYSGFTTLPTSMTGRLANGSTTIVGSACTPGGGGSNTTLMTCTLGNSYASDFIIGANQSQTFNLYVTTSGAANTGTNSATISSSLSASGFIWDDTSNNGGTGSVGLTGTTPGTLYNFPTNSYTIHQ